MDKAIEKEIKKGFKAGIKKIPLLTWFIIPCVLLACVLTYSINFRINAQATGGMLGEGSGKLVGRAIGSIDGLTQGQIAGYEAGKKESLIAKDTTAELSGKIQEVEKLEVLVASGTFSDVLSIGEDPINYAVLLSMKYNAVFTVNLGTADIELREDGLHILLDQPEVEFIPIGEIEKKNEYQRSGFIFKPGSVKAGYVAADNSLNELKVKAQEKLQNDASMMKSARLSANTQLTQLVNAVSLKKPPVFVEYRGGAGNE